MTSYVTFPGTAGNYISTEDVNLLDADTAHLLQSMPWVASAGTLTDLGVQPSGFGAYRFTDTGGLGTVKRLGLAIPLPTDTMIFSCLLTNSTDIDEEFLLRVLTDAGSVHSGVITVSARATVEMTCSVYVGSTELQELSIENRATHAAGATFDFTQIVFREGTDPTFVPSLRIVGDLDIVAKVAADDWTTATDRIILDNYDGASGYRLFLDTSDNVALAAFGTTGAITETTAAFTLVNGTATIIRVVLDVSAGTMDWLQDGTSVDATDTFTAQPLVGSDIGLYVGSLDSDADWFDGDIYYVEIRDGEDGPVVARMDAADAAGAV